MRPFLRTFVVILIAISAATSLRAQSSIVYGNPNLDEEGYEVIATSDGGYMVGGHTSDTTGGVQYWVVKVNGIGQVAWDTVYQLGYDRAFLWSIQPDGNGGALLAGYTGVQNSGEESALVLDIDSLGRITKQFDLNYTRADHAHWFARRKTGGYFWAGHTDSESDSTGVMILMRLDENLDSVWQKTYSYHPNSSEHAHCGTLTSDGGCVLAGHTTLNNQEHTWAVRVDSNGNVIWKKLFTSSGSVGDSPYGITTTAEGNFAIFGGADLATGGKMRLLVVDSAGNKIVDKLYGSGSAWGYDGFQSSDGGFVVVGYTQSQTEVDALVLRTDAKGTQRWIKQYTGEGSAYGYCGFQHRNQFVIVGGTAEAGASTGDLWAIYIDTNGNQVSYDTSRVASAHKNLLFSLDSSSLHYVNGQYINLKGSIQNPNDDSIYYNLNESISMRSRASIIVPMIASKPIPMDSITADVRRSVDLLGIAAHETLPVQISMSLYGYTTDTVQVCYSLEPVAESKLTSPACVTLYPLNTQSNGISPHDRPENLSLLPNPASDHITISGADAHEHYQIFNAAGMLIASGVTSPQIGIRSLPAGTYEIVIGSRAWPFSVVR